MESSFDENTIPLGDAFQIKSGESNKKNSKSSSSQQDFNGQRMSSDPISKRSNFISDQKGSQSKQTNKREHSEESDDEKFPCKGCPVETLKQNTVLRHFAKTRK